MNRAESALQFISPIDRSIWVAMGMALHSEYGDTARDIWTNWSRQAKSFNEMSARSVWKSFKGQGVSIASLYHEARTAGWVDNDKFQKPTLEQIKAQRRAADERLSIEGIERYKAAKKAAEKAGWLLEQCKHEQHAYLASKGFPNLNGLVWRPEFEKNILCVPMYVNGIIVGLQMINKHGVKRFLSDQVTSKAEFCISSKGFNAVHFWCEGYATGLSISTALTALKLRHLVHICFSAGNLQRMAHSGIVIADRDSSGTGEKAAIATGLPYYLPEVGDFNDFHKSVGTFKCSQQLRKFLWSRHPVDYMQERGVLL